MNRTDFMELLIEIMVMERTKRAKLLERINERIAALEACPKKEE